MSTKDTEARQHGQADEPLALRLTDLLGPLPKSEAAHWHPFKYTEHQMRAYAAQEVAAERERRRELEAIVVDVCAILDGWRSDPSWTEWDQSVRDRLAAYNLKA